MSELVQMTCVKEDFSKKHSKYNAIIFLLYVDPLEYQFSFTELSDQTSVSYS